MKKYSDESQYEWDCMDKYQRTQCIKINCFKLELKKSSRKFSKEKNPDQNPIFKYI